MKNQDLVGRRRAGRWRWPLPAAQAQTLRWAAQNDILTLDPHSQNHATTNAILMHAYEGLTRYSAKYEVEPALATKWTYITPDAGALRPAQGREIPRRHALHRRRRGVLLRPHQAAAGHDADLRDRHHRHQEDRRPHGGLHPGRPQPDAAAQHHRLPHHEQGLGGKEHDHQCAGLQGQGRELRLAQRRWARALQDHRLDSPTSASRWPATRTGGTSTSGNVHRGDLHADQEPTPRAWRRCCRATWTC